MKQDIIDENFYHGLENNDLEIIEKIPKSDVHNHAGRGGRMRDLSSKIVPPEMPFASLGEMQTWFVDNVKAHCPKGNDGYLYRVEASFKQAAADNIQKLSLSYGVDEVIALGGIENFIITMNRFKERHIPDSEFVPELSLLRNNISEDEQSKAMELLSSGWFKSLDVCGNELAASLDNYVPVYRHAKSKGVLLKVHVGEFGTAEDVRSAVELLELDEVHHGIAAIDSKEVMRYLSDNKIILNTCPKSNIMLKRAEGYANHPIRRLYDEGVLITINTDDLAIFDATVSEEYLNLYNSKLFTKKELNEIRVGGLKAYGK